MKRLRWISFVLDNALPVPGTQYRVGLDPVIGLLPGGGDLLTDLISVYIVLEAVRLGVSTPMFLQMAWNIVLDLMAGSVPVVGDIFDVTWKANVRNMKLLEQHLAEFQASQPAPPPPAVQGSPAYSGVPTSPQATQPLPRPNWGLVILVMVGLVGLILGFAAVSIWLIQFLIRLIFAGN